ncbi:MAG: FkbM family methyltransferase [Terriglobia bacterium]
MAAFRVADIPARAINKFRRRILPVPANINSFLTQVPGVIHVGANLGQEREEYASLGLNVLWVEPIPSIYETLCQNISPFPQQRAICALLAAEHGQEYTLHVADNRGASSSILDFAKHRALHPDIHYSSELRLSSTTLDRVAEAIDLQDYGALVIDTQGSELLVLQGALSVLPRMRYIETEAADFESYAGCCQLSDLTGFMRSHGFELLHSIPTVRRSGLGSYYEALFENERTKSKIPASAPDHPRK